jgi:hypothetical protein
MTRIFFFEHLLFLRSTNVRPVDFASEQKTAPRLLPMSLQRAEMQQHEGTGGFAGGRGPAEGRLEEIGQLRE